MDKPSAKDQVLSTDTDIAHKPEKRVSRRALAALGLGGALFAFGSQMGGCDCSETTTGAPGGGGNGAGGAAPGGGGTGGTGGGTGGTGGGDCNVTFTNTLVGTIEDGTSKDYSPSTGQERQAIPSACWQCVARDGIVGYVEDGRLMHLEGNPKLLRTGGKLCARGQGGVGQVYNPDRLLFPMRRVANTARGAGQWERISWTQALDDLEAKLRPLITNNEPERFMWHYGRMKASNSKMIKSYFLTAFGTATTAGHTAICEANKWVAQELSWGHHYDINDVEHTGLILNFGCNIFATHTNHIPLTQRVTKAMRDNGVKMYSFDVRLSNTAARSTEWVPIKPGTDQAVILAMCQYIIANNLLPQVGKDFINTWTDIDVSTGPNAPYADRLAKLTDFLNAPRAYLQDVLAGDNQVPAYFDPNDQPQNGYTPAWAETISGVPAAKIIQLATEYANASPGATVMSYRGAVMHFNGVNTERAIQMLEAMGGNIDTQGGRVHAIGPSWSYHTTYPTPSTSTAKLSFEQKSRYVSPDHGANHRVLEGIKEAVDNNGTGPAVYFAYCYAPPYANGDVDQNIAILKNETYIPYFPVCDVAYSDTAKYADLLLPDATYLERWGWEDMASMNLIPEWYIRQPMLSQPLGEAQDMMDTAVQLAIRLKDVAPDLQLVENIGNQENFIKAACNDTAAVNDAGIAAGYANGFEFMKAEGAYWDPTATPTYQAYLTPVTVATTDPTGIADSDPATYVWEDAEGILWEGTKAEYNSGYRTISHAYKRYQGQNVNGSQYLGFKPDHANKGGRFELETPLLTAKHYPGLPIFMKIPEHQGLASDELVMTTFKLPTQTHSRTQNCKYNTEIDHHEPVWLNPATAAANNISDGDTVTLTPAKPLFNDQTQDPNQQAGVAAASMQVEVRVTDGVVPGVLAICHHQGHWEYGRYASGKAHPMALTDNDQQAQVDADSDAKLVWWTKFGFHGNFLLPNAGDPIGGGLRFMDPVVKVS